MARGLSNGQISRELFLSEDTVKTYARRLYRAVGAWDRAHAVARGYQLGILQVPDGT
jgi:DNA-binding NarL/FixJ family response regulator